MNRSNFRPPELAVPVESLRALHVALVDQVGDDAAAHALRAAGRAAGDGLYRALASGNEGVEISAGQFWRRLAQLFSTRGWGHLRHEAVHPGIGALDAEDWVEGDALAGAMRPCCHFTTGMLANLLGRCAEQEIAVLEVECRSSGDRRCRFLFGAPETLDAVFGRVVDGASADETIASLT